MQGTNIGVRTFPENLTPGRYSKPCVRCGRPRQVQPNRPAKSEMCQSCKSVEPNWEEVGYVMSTPMYDTPEHFPIEVDADGAGPCARQDVVATVCWCGAPDCTLWQEEWGT